MKYIHHILASLFERRTKTIVYYFSNHSYYSALKRALLSHRQYLGGGSLLITANLATTLANLGIVYIFANYVSPETYGTYKYVLSIASILSIFTLQGMNTAVVQSVSRGHEHAVKEAVQTKIHYGFIGTLFGLLISGYYFLQGNPVLGGAFFITALAVPFFETFNLYRAYLNGKKLYRSLAKEMIFYNAAFFIVFATILAVTDDIVLILGSYFLASVLLQLFFYHKVTGGITAAGMSDPDLTRYSKHLSLMKALSVASGSISAIALWHILGPLALPVYALALAPIEQIRPMLQLAESLLIPKMSQDTWHTYSLGWFFKKTFPFFMTITLIIVAYIALAPLLFSVLFPKYMEAVLFSQIFSISLLFTGLNILLATIMKSKKHIRSLHVTNSITMLFDLLSIAAIYLFGIMGLILTILIAKAAVSAASIWFLFIKKV